MAADNATLTEALAELRNNWAVEVDGVLTDKYSVWLGSGISRERLPGLKELLGNILTRLQGMVNAGDPGCPFRRLLTEIFGLTTVRGIDPATPVHLWNGGNPNELIEQLISKYPEVLDKDLRENGAARDLFWEVLELQRLYADPTVPPDAEHVFLSLLVHEGILTDFVTTNWDPLIEVADQNARQTMTRTLKVVACNEELDGSRDGGCARLLKVHGCARKALGNPDRYRSFIVATRSQINNWITGALHAPIRIQIGSLLHEKRAFFIGLSGQDFNLQAAYVTASLQREPFPVNPSRVLFSEPEIRSSQQAILKAVYSDENYRAHANEIDRKAALPLYAKPLLGSLYLLTLIKKLELFLTRGAGDMEAWERALAEQWLIEVETSVCARYDSISNLNERWRQLAQELPHFISRFLCLYRRQEIPPTLDTYEALSDEDLERMTGDPNLPLLNMHWVLLAVALMAEGGNRGLWVLGPPSGEEGEYGQLIIGSPVRTIRLFVIRDPVRLAQLEKSGFVESDSANDVLVVYPRGSLPPRSRRSPRRASLPRSTVSPKIPQLALMDVLRGAATVDEALENLRLEFA